MFPVRDLSAAARVASGGGGDSQPPVVRNMRSPVPDLNLPWFSAMLGAKEEDHMTYESFVDLPVWQKAAELYELTEDLLENESFRARSSRRNGVPSRCRNGCCERCPRGIPSEKKPRPTASSEISNLKSQISRITRITRMAEPDPRAHAANEVSTRSTTPRAGGIQGGEAGERSAYPGVAAEITN